jgi:hypothetical protein
MSSGAGATFTSAASSELRECVVGFEPRRGDGHLEHRNQVPPPRLRLNTGRHERLPSVREHDDITELEVRRRVLEEAEVITGCVMETVDRHAAQYRPAGGPLGPRRSFA